MRNPILDLIGNSNTGDNTDGLLKMAMSIRPTPVKNRATRDDRRSLLYNVTDGATTAKLPTGNTNGAVDSKVPSESNLGDFINRNRGLKYSQENRYKPGYGDCSTFACNLQKEVYGRTVPDTTLGMMQKGNKVANVKPGTVSIYDTGNGNRHAVTWLPNGNVIQLGTTGVKERPGNYYSNRYPLIGNYRF